jgi:glycosyltransferase involved in cell wall biosynthesis
VTETSGDQRGTGLVSIIIPCFNQERFLADAIDSARAQTWPSIETVVIDDGSTDSSVAIARSYPDVRVVSQANQGLATARNVGLHVSRGEILIFLDADDRLLPQAAEAGVECLDRNPSASFAFGRCVLIDEGGGVMKTDQPRVTMDFYRELLLRNYIWTPALVAFRRRIFDRVGGFDPRVNPSADYELYLRISREHEIVAHDVLVAEYRRHAANMTGDPVLMLRAILSVLRSEWRFARRSPECRAAYREGVLRWRGFYGEYLVERFRGKLHRRGERFAAVQDAARLLHLYPRGVAHHLRKKLALSLRITHTSHSLR